MSPWRDAHPGVLTLLALDRAEQDALDIQGRCLRYTYGALGLLLHEEFWRGVYGLEPVEAA